VRTQTNGAIVDGRSGVVVPSRWATKLELVDTTFSLAQAGNPTINARLLLEDE
jgi:hypothetical protein